MTKRLANSAPPVLYRIPKPHPEPTFTATTPFYNLALFLNVYDCNRIVAIV